MFMTTSSYIAVAEETIRYVKRKLDIGASNKVTNLINPLNQIVKHLAVEETRRQQDAIMRIMKTKQDNWQSYVEIMADTARTMGAGNCGEHAAVAFMYLVGKGVRPLDYVVYTDRDHACVILGRKAGTNMNNFREWTDGAVVVCDPWRGRSGIAGMLAIWYGSIKLESKYRLD